MYFLDFSLKQRLRLSGLRGQILLTLRFFYFYLKATLTPTIILSLRYFPFEQQLRSKEFAELWNFAKIILLTLPCHLFPHCFWIRPTSIAGLLAVHKANCGQDQASYVPCRGPRLLMVVSKWGTNGQIDFESTRWREEEKLGSIKRIIFMQFEQSVV